MAVETMYDGSPSHIPRSAKVVVTSPQFAKQWPDAKVLTLDHTGTHPDYDILDFEKIYFYSPDKVRKWAQDHQRMRGTAPTIYANKQNYWKIAPKLQGIEWNWWARDVTGVAHMYHPVGGQKQPVATQWFGSGLKNWNHFDVSQADSKWLASIGQGHAKGGGGGGTDTGGGQPADSGTAATYPVPPDVYAPVPPVSHGAAATAGPHGGNLLIILGLIIIAGLIVFWQVRKRKQRRK